MVNNKQKVVKILDNKKITDKYFKLSFISPWPAKSIKVGQFIEVKINDGFSPLLRKPFSIHRVVSHQSSAISKIEVLYEVVGEGTEQLSKKKPGESLDIIGPLGNGFDYQLPITNYHLPILVAGGIGVAPLVAVAEKLMLEHKVQRTEYRVQSTEYKITVLLGAKTKKRVLCEKEFKKLGCDVKISTDDGSKGNKGFITELLSNILRTTHNTQRTTLYACGPKPMLKEVARIAKAKKIPCQILLEEYMACGIGVCLGCAVKTRDGYKMVCKDGPVFEAGEVIWE